MIGGELGVARTLLRKVDCAAGGVETREAEGEKHAQQLRRSLRASLLQLIDQTLALRGRKGALDESVQPRIVGVEGGEEAGGEGGGGKCRCRSR